MGSLWRSEPMHMVQLFIQTEAAHDTVDELGALGAVEFVDLNPSVSVFQRHFVREVRRQEELGRKLRYFESEALRAGLSVPRAPPANSPDVAHKPLHVDELEAQFDDLEKDLRDITQTYDTLQRDANELVELKLVLERTAHIFADGNALPSAHDALAASADPEAAGHERTALLSGDTIGAPTHHDGPGQLGFVAGVIVRDKLTAFERILWRATRGNLFMENVEIPGLVTDPQTGNDEQKNVVVIFFQGAQSEQKIKRICDSRGVHLYPCPETADDRNALLGQVEERLREMNDVLEKSRAHRDQLLRNLAAQLGMWKAKVAREKAIADTMNLFNYDVGRKCLVAVGWCAVERTSEVQAALRRGSERCGALTPSILSVVRTTDTPPTHFTTNKLTMPFHGLVAAYGVARYREINPTPFTVITFPFLFGIMFGDVGHGLLMLLFAAALVLFERRFDARTMGEMDGMIFGARYMLLLMGFFSFYVGLLYNEAFGVGLDFFGGSRWMYSNDPAEACDTKQWCRWTGVYPFGVDPAWKGADNEITFYNMLKMKVSIIFGVVHMTIGIVLSGLNARFFRQVYDFWFVVIPSFVFFVSMFGYLAFLIVLKWIKVRSDGTGITDNESLPKIMNIMIDMFLSPFSCCGDLEKFEMTGERDKYLDDRLYPGQPGVQAVLFLLVVACVPVMLCGKPYMLWRDNKNRSKYQLVVHADDNEGDMSDDDDADLGEVEGMPGNKGAMATPKHPDVDAVTSAAGIVLDDDPMNGSHDGGHGGHGGHGGKAFDFGEIMMHQIIHSIEFILGAISNTASYLRLWALSLAHAELSVVFWERGFLGLLANSKEGAAKCPHPPSEGGMTSTAMGTAASSTTTAMPTSTSAATSVMSTVASAMSTMMAGNGTMPAGGGGEKVEKPQTAGMTAVYAFVGFSAWLAATLGVLMCMESLSAFLHATRLHWVEFANKFYLGDGVEFQPFDFDKLDEKLNSQDGE